jgi:hypothetical protein
MAGVVASSQRQVASQEETIRSLHDLLMKYAAQEKGFQAREVLNHVRCCFGY